MHHDDKTPQHAYCCGVLTISDKGSRGERVDTSGPAVAKMLAEARFSVKEQGVVPDDEAIIRDTLISWADIVHLDLIVTTGGTGVAPSDVTPEATRMVIEREIPGISEAMRSASLAKTMHAVLSRGITGIRGNCLVVNLPGSERAATENLEVVLTALPHALAKIQGDPSDCAQLQP